MSSMEHLPAFAPSVKESRRSHPSIHPITLGLLLYLEHKRAEKRPVIFLTNSTFDCVAITTLLPVPTPFSVQIRDNVVLRLPVCEMPGEGWMT